MLDLVLENKDGNPKVIKSKNKAIARFVTGLKLKKKPIIYTSEWNEYNGWFYEFGNRALSLGATPKEIQDAFDSITHIPIEIVKKHNHLSTKRLDDRFVCLFSKAILKAKFDIVFVYHGNALTLEGKDAMGRNGRKWTIGYKTIIDKKINFAFDAITDEGFGPTSYVIDKANSDTIFSDLSSFERYRVKELINQVLTRIQFFY